MSEDQLGIIKGKASQDGNAKIGLRRSPKAVNRKKRNILH